MWDFQEEDGGRRTRPNKKTSTRDTCEEPLLTRWKKDDKMFVETRASSYVHRCVTQNSLVTVTGSCGVGKTSTARHVSLEMAASGYTIIEVSTINDLRASYNPRAFFVLDDFFGKYLIDGVKLYDWRARWEEIKTLLEAGSKIIITCRLQIYQDELFQELPFLSTFICNFNDPNLCLNMVEKHSIAKMYLEEDSYKIAQYADLHDCFPLLCRLYSEHSKFNIKEFFQSPFAVYEQKITSLSKYEYCALALCVIFNNRVNEEWLMGRSDENTQKVIEKTLEACRLDKSISRQTLKSAFESVDVFIFKDLKQRPGILRNRKWEVGSYHRGIDIKDEKQKTDKSYHGGIDIKDEKQKTDELTSYMTYVEHAIEQITLSRNFESDSDVFTDEDNFSDDKKHKIDIFTDDEDFDRRTYSFLHEKLGLKHGEGYIFYAIHDKIFDFLVSYFGNVMVKCLINNADSKIISERFLYENLDSSSTFTITLLEKHLYLFIDRMINDWLNGKIIDVFFNANMKSKTFRDILMKRVKRIKQSSQKQMACMCNIYKRKSPEIATNSIRQDIDGLSPLSLSSFLGYLEIVQWCCMQNVNVDEVNSRGETPLYIARVKGYTAIAEMLIDSGANIDNLTNGETSLYVACKSGDQKIVQVLLSSNANINKRSTKQLETPLYVACERRYEHIVKILLENNADTEITTNSGFTPLDIACHKSYIEIIKLLLDNTVRTEHYTIAKNVLYDACVKRDIRLVKLLLEYKVDIDACTKNEETPLYAACKRGYFEIVEFLLSNNADVNKFTEKWETPLYVACERGDKEIVNILLNHEANVNKKTWLNKSPLHIACENGDKDIVEMLLENKASTNEHSFHGDAPLHVACKKRFTDIMKLFVNMNLNIEITDAEGRTSLFLACERGYTEIVKLLLEENADTCHYTDNGESVLFISCEKGYPEIINVLLNHQATYNKAGRIYKDFIPAGSSFEKDIKSAYENYHEAVKRATLTMTRYSSRASRQKDKFRKQQMRSQVQQTFLYLPADNTWRSEQFTRLQIPSELPTIFEQIFEPLPLLPPTIIHQIKGDGNCLFNALSYVLTGSQEYHSCIRSQICTFMRTSPNEMLAILPLEANRNVSCYLQNTQMERNGIWGTEVELTAAATLLQTNIFVYSKSGVHWKWIRYPPHNLSVTHGIYLYHKNENHFDSVIAIQNSNTLSAFSEGDYYYEDSMKKYQTDSIFREKKKQCSKKSANKRYQHDHVFRTAKKESQINKYKCDDKQRVKICLSQRRKYHQNKSYRDKQKLTMRSKYWNNKQYRLKSKLRSAQRYCCNSKFRNRLKELSKVRYSTDIDYQQKKRGNSRRKYEVDSEHQNKVKESSKRKYKFDCEHQERVKESSKRKYKFDCEHQERVKKHSKRKYKFDCEHQERVKKYSKRKYAENKAHRLGVQQYSKTKYQRFASFRNHVKASSVKKYSTNPLFRCALKNFLRNRYHQSRIIQKEKKKRVYVARQSVDNSIANFKRNISCTPHYICLICIRLLYRSQVKECKRAKYSVGGVLNAQAHKCFSESFSHNCIDNRCPDTCWIKLSITDKQWICHNCDRHLKQGSMPPQAQANNLTLVPIPPELSKLNELERQLIALRIAFMKLLSLPRGGQKGVKGPVVNVPSDLTSITSSLPRNINDAQLIKVKLKRKLQYKGHYSYKWITPANVIQALKILKSINIWFKDIKIDESWLQENNDIDLIQQSNSDESDSDIDEENDSEDDNTLNMPVETCFQPVDIGQDILDTNNTLCIAPGENEKPQNIFQEKGSDAMAFPTLLPDGHFGLFEDREIKLSPSKYFNARLFSADTRFSSNKEFIFFAQYVTEIQQITSNISLALRKGQPTTENGQPVTASMLLDSNRASDILKSDIGYRFLQPVRGTPPYWQRTMKDLYAMIHQIGIPTWFVTFSAAETRWEEVIETLLLLKNDKRQVKDIEWSEKCSLITDNPVICSRLFDHRVKCLFTDLIMSASCPVGKVVDYFYRTEFQQRGSPHIHCLLWIKDAPKFNENTDQEVCNFIDQYITCRMPNSDEDPELFNIISSVQVHNKTHSKSCKKYSSTCRFNFPRPPIRKTFIARSDSTEKQNQPASVPTTEELDEMSRSSARTPKKILRDVWLLLSTADETNHYSLSKILQLVDITYPQFKQCLVDVATRNTVHLKRTISDVWVNNYNENLSRAWNANLDIQYVTDAYACVAYILSYISKSETELGDLLQNAQQEADEGNKDAASAMRKIGNIYVQNREVSAQEAVYRVCGLHLKQCTREVVFVPVGSRIFKMSLPISMIKSRFSQSTDDEQDIWMPSIHEKYYARPDTEQFNIMALAEFASKFRFISKSQNPRSTPLLPVFQLRNGFGHIKKRKAGKEAVIRYPRFNVNKNPEDYHLALAQLFLPHRSAIALPEGIETFESYIKNGTIEGNPILPIIERNRHQFEKDADSLEKAWTDLQEGKIPQDSWGAIDPENEVERIEIQMEQNNQDLEEQDEIPELVYDNKLNQDKRPFHYEPPTSSQELIKKAIRSMNEIQQQIFYKIRDWCNQLVWGNSPEPFHVFLTGGAGTGKSHLIRCIYHDMTRILSKFTTTPDSTSILLTAPTGTAAFNIQGMTIHSAFAINKNVKLPYQPLGENLLNTLRSKFDTLQILIIDEISMVDQKILTYVHGRLSQIKHCKKPFGNVSVLAVGDFYQLPPVRGLALYKKRESNFMDLWNTQFTIVTLTEIMRQKDDSYFAELLNRLRIHCKGNPLFDIDKDSLEKVSIKETPPDKLQVLHIFPTNKEVDSHNIRMISETCNPVFTSVAIDFYTNVASAKLCQKDQPYVNCLPEDLQTTIKLGVGARVMLTRNIDTEDGLVNGAFGTVTALDFNNNTKQIKAVYIKFDNQKVGQKHAKKSTANPSVTGSVYIKPFQDTLSGRKVTRKQLPLKLAWAATIHKVQGMTVDQIVVSLKKIFQPGMAYVGLSRATSLKGLHILDFNADSLYSSNDITEALQGMQPFLSCERSTVSTNTLTIINHNTEGLLPHLKDIMSVNRFKSTHIVCFTETWLKSDQTLKTSFLPDHHPYHCYRSNAYDSTHSVYSTLKDQNRGGVAVFVKQVDHELLALHFNNLEAVALKIENMCLVLVYRPPSYNLQQFTNNIRQLLEEIQQLHIPSLFLGDFNINALQTKNTQLQKMFEDSGYSQLVNFPTTEAGTCLDLVFMHGFHEKPEVSAFPTYYSFHDGVQICLPNFMLE